MENLARFTFSGSYQRLTVIVRNVKSIRPVTGPNDKPGIEIHYITGDKEQIDYEEPRLGTPDFREQALRDFQNAKF